MLSLITWLLLCNIIQGINSLVWASNIAVHVPVWCDIVTKVLLGAWVALPAACLCLCRHLQNCARQVETKGRRSFLALDLALCVAVPVLYMAIHVIVQDRRFDLVEEYGCEPSIYISTPAVILIWLPPFVLCVIAFCYAFLALLNFRQAVRVTSLRNSSGFRVLTFIRPILTAFIIVSLILSSSAFSLHARIVSTAGLEPWTSWVAVHAQLSAIRVIPPTAGLELIRVAITWWAIPACSLVLISAYIVGFACGAREEVLRGYRYSPRWFRTDTSPRRTDLFTDPALDVRLNSSMMPMPVYLPTTDVNDTLRSTSSIKAKAAPLSISIPGHATVSPPTSSASDDSDGAFVQSTLNYVGSPTGREALGLPLLPPSLARPRKPAPLPLDQPISTIPPALHLTSGTTTASPRSILDGPWPRPPSAIPTPVAPIMISPPTPQPDASASGSRPASASSLSTLSTSLASSTISAHAYAQEPERGPGQPLGDSPTLPHFPPFGDAGVPAAAQSSTLAVPRRARRKGSKDRIVTRNLSLSSRPRERGAQYVNGFGPIYMTVVKETD
ncbi:predicted protein [Sparassis crispa]|uniref:Pheromone B beta 1 receptor n=1 Tax=Sparassis crispa TaxID=139825 RepID=A0A401GXX7_9APHY|nr:predicted protein [Sparassis crispa]GBE87051.1 predicted protein [Sparassis crispa]